jgi:hypothetical protein
MAITGSLSGFPAAHIIGVGLDRTKKEMWGIRDPKNVMERKSDIIFF